MGPTDEFERAARLRGYRRIAGIDEVGRGPLAGPVVAAAVVLPVRSRLAGVNDSKQLSERERERFYITIREQAVGVGIGWADVAEIDRLNILEARCGERLSRKEKRFGCCFRLLMGAR